MAISAPITFRFGPCDAHCLSYGTEIFTLFLLTFILGTNLFNESSLSLDMTKAAVAAAAAERDRRRDKAGEEGMLLLWVVSVCCSVNGAGFGDLAAVVAAAVAVIVAWRC